MSIALVRYDAARKALADARSVDEVKDIRDKMQALSAYARQAGDTEMVEWATEIKVRAERRAGELLREVERARAGRGGTGEKGIRSTLERIDVPVATAHRWQKLAAVPASKFEQAVAAAKEVAGEVTTAAMLRISGGADPVMYAGATDEWETPLALFALLNQEFNFTLDVCAAPGNAKCERYFNKKDDGLSKEWSGACWMNPPYGDDIPKWVEKAHESGKQGATVVCLVPARTDTAWWWDHCIYGEVRFLRGRLRFGGGTSGAPFPSAVVIFGRPRAVVWWDKWRVQLAA